MRDPNHVTTHAEALTYHAAQEALTYHAAQVERDARIDADNAEYDARQAKIADILAEIAEGSIALAREVIAASKGSVTWIAAGESWAALCKATPASSTHRCDGCARPGLLPPRR